MLFSVPIGLALFGCECDVRSSSSTSTDASLGSASPDAKAAPPTSAPAPAAPPARASVAPLGAPESFAELVERADAAVVFVRTVTAQRYGFRRVLRGGSGSGFVFDPAGHILTNYHVVEGAHAIEVELADGRVLSARVRGADPHTDVAVLEVSANDLPALPLGDSDAVRVGDWVVAIGNPFGLAHTVSAGIVSAKERTSTDVEGKDPTAYYSFLQTDASINPGNSGGPLIDLMGRVVGMNTAIRPDGNNIGFAIPVNMLRDLLPRLLTEGVVRRAVIGVHLAEVDHEVAAQLGLPDRTGALVVMVQPSGPAAAAGLVPGDVIRTLDGKPAKTPDELRWRASLLPAGKPARLGVWRRGQLVELDVAPVLTSG